VTRELFGGIVDTLNGAMVRLQNGEFLPLLLAAGGVVLVGYFLFKR
jgi:hypothetical protein